MRRPPGSGGLSPSRGRGASCYAASIVRVSRGTRKVGNAAYNEVSAFLSSEAFLALALTKALPCEGPCVPTPFWSRSTLVVRQVHGDPSSARDGNIRVRDDRGASSGTIDARLPSQSRRRSHHGRLRSTRGCRGQSDFNGQWACPNAWPGARSVANPSETPAGRRRLTADQPRFAAGAAELMALPGRAAYT